MDYTADIIENEIVLLPSLLKMFSMFHISCWYIKGHYDKNKVENIAIRCSNCEKETMIYMDNMNTTYQDIITPFVWNKVLHHVGMLWPIETHEKLKYDTENHNSDWMKVGPWYNTSICKNYMEICLKNSLEMQELTYILSCVILMHTKK